MVRRWFRRTGLIEMVNTLRIKRLRILRYLAFFQIFTVTYVVHVKFKKISEQYLGAFMKSVII